MPTKSATLEHIRALEAGCAGDGPLDLRDRGSTSILKTTAARNSSVRLLRLEDVDFERALIRFRRAKVARPSTSPSSPRHARPSSPTSSADAQSS